MAVSLSLDDDFITITAKRHSKHLFLVSFEVATVPLSRLALDVLPRVWYFINENVRKSIGYGRESVRMVLMDVLLVRSNSNFTVCVSVVPLDCMVFDSVSKDYLVTVSEGYDEAPIMVRVVHGVAVY